MHICLCMLLFYWINVCVHMYADMYVCVNEFEYVLIMYVYVYHVCEWRYAYLFEYKLLYVSLFECMKLFVCDVYVCMCSMYEWRFILMYDCEYVMCVYIGLYIAMYVFWCSCMYFLVCVCSYVDIYVYMYVYVLMYIVWLDLCVCDYESLYMHIYMYLFTEVCICK